MGNRPSAFATLFAMVVAVLVTGCNTETPEPTLNYIVGGNGSGSANPPDTGNGDTDTGGDPVVDTGNGDTADTATDTGEEYQVTSWFDHDGDGYGDPAVSLTAGTMPAGFVANGLDCDDDVAAVNPAATEVCDAVDNDCNGVVDDSYAMDTLPWAVDADGDGYGVFGATVQSCSQPPGYADNATDCNDTDDTVNPGADEVSNDVDDDCNGTVDDVGDFCCPDADGDSYGASTGCEFSSTSTCPSGYVVGDGDCDDSNGSVSPAQPIDIAGDGEDDNCNGDPDK